ncbi:MAG TPA: hypothetical protein VIK72_14195 [Clostridiaceae bacterium]
MSDKTINTKAFITTLKFGSMQKQVFFEGEDSEQGNKNYKNTLLLLNKIGDTSTDWVIFFNRAVELFRSNGFIRIAK